MSKLKILGIAIAALLLIFALAARTVGGETAVDIMLPLLALMTAVLFFVDATVYKRSRSDQGTADLALLIRMISLAVVSVLLICAVIYNILV